MLCFRKWYKLLQVNQIALLPAMAILCVLETAPCRIMESENLQISVSDNHHFDKLASSKHKVRYQKHEQ